MCFQSISSWGLENVLLKCPSLKQCFAHKFNAWSMFLLCRFCIWGCKNVQSFSKQRQTPTNRKWLTNWKPWHVLRICTCTYVQCGYLIAAFSLAMQKDTIIPSCIHGFFWSFSFDDAWFVKTERRVMIIQADLKLQCLGVHCCVINEMKDWDGERRGSFTLWKMDRKPNWNSQCCCWSAVLLFDPIVMSNNLYSPSVLLVMSLHIPGLFCCLFFIYTMVQAICF